MHLWMEQLSLVNYECPMLFDEWCNPKSKIEHDATQVPEYASKSILHRRCNAMDHEMPCLIRANYAGMWQSVDRNVSFPANLPVVFQHSVWWLSQAMGIHHLQHPFHASPNDLTTGIGGMSFNYMYTDVWKTQSTVHSIRHTRLINNSTVETLPSKFPSQPYHRCVVKDKHINWIHTAW